LKEGDKARVSTHSDLTSSSGRFADALFCPNQLAALDQTLDSPLYRDSPEPIWR
jgi:hypothetical protein